MIVSLISITVSGLLMGAVVWWFFGRTASEGTSQQQGSRQEAHITVLGGYNPEVTSIKAGVPADLRFMRKDQSACLEEVIFPDFGIQQKLTVNKEEVVTLPALKPGEYAYSCGMRMFHGKVVVK